MLSNWVLSKFARRNSLAGGRCSKLPCCEHKAQSLVSHRTVGASARRVYVLCAVGRHRRLNTAKRCWQTPTTTRAGRRHAPCAPGGKVLADEQKDSDDNQPARHHSFAPPQFGKLVGRCRHRFCAGRCRLGKATLACASFVVGLVAVGCPDVIFCPPAQYPGAARRKAPRGTACCGHAPGQSPGTGRHTAADQRPESSACCRPAAAVNKGAPASSAGRTYCRPCRQFVLGLLCSLTCDGVARPGRALRHPAPSTARWRVRAPRPPHGHRSRRCRARPWHLRRTTKCYSARG